MLRRKLWAVRSNPYRCLLPSSLDQHTEIPESDAPVTDAQAETLAALVERSRRFADDLAARPGSDSVEPPLAEIAQMAELGLLLAPLASAHGGAGLGTTAGTHLALLRTLAAIGGGDLVLGRLYEGHVNALLLITHFGTLSQLEQAAHDAAAGMLFGVWNTGTQALLQLERAGDAWRLRGAKTFASGAAFVERPIVTAEDRQHGWQMTLVRMEAPGAAEHLRIDRDFWQPLGMEASGSFGVDFTGVRLEPEDLIGAPGDFYRDPLFRGGAVRFAAVQAGGVLRLVSHFLEWIAARGRADDPYQLARAGELSLLAQAAVLWIERAAAQAEQGLSPTAQKAAAEAMVACANETRLAIERIATAAMQHVIAGVGAHGLLQPERFERILRNLTMYLRQPAPDQTLADVGRAALRQAHLHSAAAAVNDRWHEPSAGTLPPTYFDRLYADSADPWNFTASGYEAEKYAATLAALPQPHYRKALEIGCSIGVLTEQLAPRCESLLSLDVSERALAAARERCAALPQVRFACMQIPAQMPSGSFDLILVSEVAYYWGRQDFDCAAAGLARLQPAGADLVLVHFTGPVPDYPLTGDQVHDLWLARPEWDVIEDRRCEGYRLAVLQRRAT